MAGENHNIVREWLKTLDLSDYTQSFLDNGYDELETCKQIGRDDLDAIGVQDTHHRLELMRAVSRLKNEGGTAVYFTLVGPAHSDEELDYQDYGVPDLSVLNSPKKGRDYGDYNVYSSMGPPGGARPGTPDIVSQHRPPVYPKPIGGHAHGISRAFSEGSTTETDLTCHHHPPVIPPVGNISAGKGLGNTTSAGKGKILKPKRNGHGNMGEGAFRNPGTTASRINRKDAKDSTSRQNTSGSSLASSDSSEHTSPEHNVSAGTEETGASASADEIVEKSSKTKSGRSKSLTKGVLKLFKSGKSSDKNAATMSIPQKQHSVEGGEAWRAGDSNLSNEDLLKILQEFKESGGTQDDVFKKVAKKEQEVAASKKEQVDRLQSPHMALKEEPIPDSRPGPSSHHIYDEPPENYASSIDDVHRTTDNDSSTPTSPPSLMRAQSDEIQSFAPSLSASPSGDDRSDLGSAPSSSPLDHIQNRFNKLGVSLRTKFSPLVHRKHHNMMSRSNSSPTPDFGTSNTDPKGPYNTTSSASVSPPSQLVHSHHLNYEPSSDGKSTISSTNSDFSSSTQSESCDPVCNSVRPVPPEMFNEYGEYTGTYIDMAIANRDQLSLYNKEELQLKKGDVVYITSCSSEDGRWECICNRLQGRVKFVYLDVLNKADIARLKKQMRPPSLTLGGWEALLKLSNLKELLHRIGCEQYWGLLQLHQITTLDDFKHLEKQQLDDLQIRDDTHRIELLTAAKVLRDPKSDEATASRLSQASRTSTTSATTIADNPLQRYFSEQRDSGFYAEGHGSAHRKPSEGEEAASSGRSSQEAISEEQEQNNENYNNSNGLLLGNGHYLPGLRGSPTPDQGRPGGSPVRDSATRGRGSPCHVQCASSVPDLQSRSRQGSRQGSPVLTTTEHVQQISYQPVYHRHDGRRDVVQALNWTNYPTCPYSTNQHRDIGAVDMLSAHGGTMNGGMFRTQSTRRNYSFDETESGIHSDPGIEGVSTLMPLQRPPTPQRWYTHDTMTNQYQRRPSEPSTTIARPGAVAAVDNIDYWRRSSLTDVYGGRSCDVPAGKTRGAGQQSPKGLCAAHARGAAQRRHRKSRSVSPHKRHHHHHHHHQHREMMMRNVHCMPTLPLRGTQRERATSPSLDIMIENKLDQEGIDLTSLPYSDKMGFCGIPPALVQRYAEEIESPVTETAQCLEAIRVKHLVEACRCWFRSDTLAHQSQKLIYAGSGETVPDWLTSLGLPMYVDSFMTQGWDAIEIVIAMEEDDLRKCGISNSKHLRRLTTAVEHLKMTWRS